MELTERAEINWRKNLIIKFIQRSLKSFRLNVLRRDSRYTVL